MPLRPYKAITEMAFAAGAFENERKLVRHLQSHGVMSGSSAAAGPSARGTDFSLNAGGKTYNGEYKQDIHAGMGQMELRHNGKKWSPTTKPTTEGKSLLKHFNAATTTVNGRSVSFANHINRTWSKPSGNYERDMKRNKSIYSDWSGAGKVASHYRDRGVHYVQIGDELFHTHKDHANLGTTHLKDSGIQTRFRARIKGRGHDKTTGKMKYGHLTTIEARRSKSSSPSPASLYNPETLNRIKSVKPIP